MTTIQIKKDGQDPQVINVPEGAKIIIEDGVTIVEPEFKDGDVVYWENDGRAKGIAIFKKYHSINSFRFDYHFLLRIDFNICSYKDWADCTLGSTRSMRLATESEKQLLIDALAKDGKQWNQSTKQIEELKYIPKVGDCVKLTNGNESVFIEVSSVQNGRPCGYRSIVCGAEIDTNNIMITPWADHWHVEKITPEELQSKFNRLGYEYNFETHTADKFRWRPKVNEKYYVPSPGNESFCYCFTNFNREFDTHRINKNLAFKTPEEAIEVAKRWLQQL